MGLNMKVLHDMHPKDVRQLIRNKEITGPTSGMCAGYAQANLVVLDRDDAAEFEEFANNNPKPCPVLEITKDTPLTSITASGANILKDIPKYRIWMDGKLVSEPLDAGEYWQEGMRGFLIGCSFSFEEALINEGIGIRHITLGCNVPMYKTNIQCKPSGGGKFYGPMVVSMRPIHKNLVDKAIEITSRFPRVHGAPVHIGDPKMLGITDINEPDYGDAVYINEGEVPVFWACGVTPQAAIEQARLPFVITHAPGHMFISDLLNETLATPKVPF